MKYLSHVLIALCSFLFFIDLHASPLATFNYKRFYVPGKGPFIETYFDISGSSILLEKLNSGAYQGQVELTLIFKKGEEIVTFDKKVLQSPEMEENETVDFLDVQRFALQPGTYDLEINMRDVLNPEDAGYTSHETIEIEEPSKSAFLSDIELVSAFKKTETPGIFSKSGYDMLPMVSDDYLNPSMNQVVLYFEIYGMEQLTDTSVFLTKVFLKTLDTDEPVASTMKYLRRETAPVVPIFTSLSLEGIPTGQYLLMAEARTKDNELVAFKSMRVTRTAPRAELDPNQLTDAQIAASWTARYTDKNVLFEHVHSIRPIADDKVIFYLDNTFQYKDSTELAFLQRFLYAFWKSRSELNSETEWLQYKAQVEYVQGKYGTRNKKGWQTDRGRVFLKYGPPNDIVDRAQEPSSYPYQIWRYYKTDIFNNVKFVFYDPTLMSIDYELLHCEYIPGERRTPQWKLLLETRNTPTNNVDRQDGRDHFGGRVDDFYENPR